MRTFVFGDSRSGLLYFVLTVQWKGHHRHVFNPQSVEFASSPCVGMGSLQVHQLLHTDPKGQLGTQSSKSPTDTHIHKDTKIIVCIWPITPWERWAAAVPHRWVQSRETIGTIYIVCGMNQLGSEPTTSRSQGGHSITEPMARWSVCECECLFVFLCGSVMHWQVLHRAQRHLCPVTAGSCPATQV